MIALRAAPPVADPEIAASTDDLCVDRWHIVATRVRNPGRSPADRWEYTISDLMAWGEMIQQGRATTVQTKMDGVWVTLGKLAKYKEAA